MRLTLTALATALLLTTGPAAALAQTGSALPPDEIEEDWEIILGVPDLALAGPQISTTMSPTDDGSSPFFVFDLNYRTEPSFQPGGMQVTAWQGADLLSSSARGTARCSTTGEKITWTQRIKLTSGVLNFAIDSGRSTTWGRFGQGQQLNVGGSFPTTLTDLSRYSPLETIANSGVGWQRSRVQSMAVTTVRYYAAGKLLRTETTPRYVDLTR